MNEKLISLEKLDTQRALGIRVQDGLYEQNLYRQNINPTVETKPIERYGPNSEYVGLKKVAPTADRDIHSKNPTVDIQKSMHNVAKLAERTKSMRDMAREHNAEEVENAFIESIFGESGLKLLQDSKKHAVNGVYSKTRNCLQKFINKFESMTNPDGIDIMQNVRQKLREVETFDDVEIDVGIETPKEVLGEMPKVKKVHIEKKKKVAKENKEIIRSNSLKVTKRTEVLNNGGVFVPNSTVVVPQNDGTIRNIFPSLTKQPGVYIKFKSGNVTYINIGSRQELPINLSDPLERIEMVESGNISICSAKRQKIHIMTTEGSEVKLRKIKINVGPGMIKNIDAKNMVLTDGGWLWEKALVFECSYFGPKKNSIKKKIKGYLKTDRRHVLGVVFTVLFLIFCLYVSSPSRISSKNILTNAF